jgi:TonB family protein
MHPLLRTCGAGLLASAALVLAARDGRAQAAQAVATPRPLVPLHADYPEQATGEATVVLVLTVGIDGAVRSARIVAGDEPFASAALRAASRFRFEPAKKDGKPIAVTFRVAIRFTAPSGPPSTRASVDTAAPPASAVHRASSSAAPLEVTVHGTPPPPAVHSMSRADVDLLPGAFGDPFRALEALPGVAPLVSGLPYFFVRGAPPGNVGYFIDGIHIPLLFHVAAGPSVIHPGLVDRVDLYPGGYPAAVGDFVGGVVAAETRPPRPEWHGEGTLRLVDAGAQLEGPIPGVNGSFFAAARYSYTAAVLSLVSPSVSLGYWDYQLRADAHPNARDEFGVFAFGAFDHLGSSFGGAPAVWDSTFHRIDLRYDRHSSAPEDRLREAVTLGYDASTLALGHAHDYVLASRTEITKRVTDTVLVRAGASAELRVYDSVFGAIPKVAPPSASYLALTDDIVSVSGSAFTPHTAFQTSLHVDTVGKLSRSLEVVPGMRVELYESRGRTRVAADPRFSGRLAVTSDVHVVVAVGLASQPPSFLIPIPGIEPTLDGGLQRSLQTSAGVEVNLPYAIQATATVYSTLFFGVTDPLNQFIGLDYAVAYGTGTAYYRANPSSIGLELSAKRRLTRRLGGFVSYTLSRTSMERSPLGLPTQFDHAHVLNVAVMYDFGAGFRGGLREFFASGTPAWTFASFATEGPRQDGRLPPFFRLDARLEKRWSFGAQKHVTAVLEVQNALFAKEEVQAVSCPAGGCAIGPLTIPSLGVEAGF